MQRGDGNVGEHIVTNLCLMHVYVAESKTAMVCRCVSETGGGITATVERPDGALQGLLISCALGLFRPRPMLPIAFSAFWLVRFLF